MLCALTVRTLKPGTFDQFRETFMGLEDMDDLPAEWVRFNMIRNAENPDEVICFGFFDGTVDQLRASAADTDRAGQLEKIAPFVESVGADGLYEVVEQYPSAPAASS